VGRESLRRALEELSGIREGSEGNEGGRGNRPIIVRELLKMGRFREETWVCQRKRPGFETNVYNVKGGRGT